MTAVRLAVCAVALAAAPVAAQTAPPDSAAIRSAAADTTLAPAEAAARFLAEVAARPGVERSRSGVLWTVGRRGSGQRPLRSEAVEAEYVGRLADGTVFDQTRPRTPVRLPLRAVVPGLAEALVEMRPGERRTVYLPPALAYGAAGVPGPGGVPRVPPHAALVFEITLVRVTR